MFIKMLAQKAFWLQPWALLRWCVCLAYLMLEGCVGSESILAAALGTFRRGDGLAKVMQDAGVGTEGSVAAALALLDLFDRLAIMMPDSRVGRVCIMAAALGTFRRWDC